MLAQAVTDPFRFRAHPDVWLLVAFLLGAHVYMVRVVGPHAVAAGQRVVTGKNVAAFAGAMAVALGRQRLADPRPRRELPVLGPHAPAHDAELLHAAPGAAGDAGVAVAGDRRPRPRLRRCCGGSATRSSPAVLFNLSVMITHIPGVVDASVQQRPRSTTCST